MKKVCFIATISKTIEWFMLEQAEFLSENNYDVYIICDNDDSFKNKLSDKITFLPVKMKRGIDFSAIKSIFSLYKTFKQHKFDIIQYTTPNASLYSSVAGLFARIPHRIYRQWGMVYIGFDGLKRAVFKFIEKLICKLSTFILPDSYGNLDFCRRNHFYSENKSTVISNGSACGVDFSRFDITKKIFWRNEIRKEYEIDDDCFVFGFIGRINKDKGINELLTAFKEFNKSKKSKLFLVGLSDRENEINSDLIAWAKKSDDVIFTDVTSEAEKFYSALDVFVLPSYREGFGTTIIEAEAMGLPVITTKIPGPTEAIIDGETGILVNPRSDKELLDAMNYLHNNPEICSQMSNAGINFVKNRFDRKMLFNENLNFLNGLR